MANPFSYPAYDLLSAEPLDPLPYQQVSFGAPLNQAGSFTGQLPLADPRVQQFDYSRATQVTSTAVFVDLYGQLVWGGILWSSSYDSADKSKLLKVGATEFGSYFAQRLQARDYTNTWSAGQDPMLIAQELIEDALAKGTVMGGITVTLHPASGEGGVKVAPSYPGTSLQTLESILSILSQMGYSAGFDYSLDCAYAPGTRTPAVRMNFYWPRKGRRFEQSQLVLLGKDCTYTYPVDGTQRSTSITETGSGATDPATASVALPDVPLLERTFSRSQVTDEGTLAAITLGDLGLYCYPVVTPTFTIPLDLSQPGGRAQAEAPLQLGSFDRGDDFLFRIDPQEGGGLNTDPRFPHGCQFEWRINSWQCNVADKGLSTIVITAGIPPLAFIPPLQPPL